MIRQDKLSWSKGRADAMRGAPSKCPKGLDEASPARHQLPQSQDAPIADASEAWRPSTGGRATPASLSKVCGTE